MFELKKFTGTSQRNENRITVTSHYSFGFPTRFFKDNSIENFKYVVLYYDENQHAVGFQFTNDENEPHKFTVIKSKRGYGGSVIATSFFKTYNIDSREHKGRYDWTLESLPEGNQAFVIKLKIQEQKSTALNTAP